MSILIAEMPHRPNVSFKASLETKEVSRGKKRFRFTFRVHLQKISMYISFPKAGGVRIRNGYAGNFEPDALCDVTYTDLADGSIKLEGTDTFVIVRDLYARWTVEVYNKEGELKTKLDNGNCRIWGIDINERFASSRLEFPIAKEEHFFGFGERFSGFYQNGMQPLMWNIDIEPSPMGGSMADEYCEKPQGYKNVPLVHSTRDYTIFFNTYIPIAFNIGERNPNIMTAEIYGKELDLYIWTGTPEKNLEQYQKLTGNPFLPPRWAFDYWIGGGWLKWNKPDSSHAPKNLGNVLDMYQQYGITINQAYVETEPTEAFFEEAKKRDLHVLMWTDSRLMPHRPSDLDYDEYRVKKKSDPKAIMPYNYIDFTSKTSLDVINEKYDPLWELGLEGQMVDFADSMPEDALCSNGKDGMAMHNEYAYWYGRRMNEGFTQRLGDNFMLFQRSGCAGSSHYTASFGGDIVSTFVGLKRSLYEILSASASGISVWGSDMGGFVTVQNEIQEVTDYQELYMRWTQFAAFSPLMRDHSWNCNHQPWDNGEAGLENFKKYYAIRLGLWDKIYSTAIDTSLYGGTMVKSMPIAFGHPSEEQYLFCEDLLVRPVTNQGENKVKVVFPEEGFVDLYDGRCFEKGEIFYDAPADVLPVFVRGGAVLPMLLDEALMPTLDKKNTVSALLLTAPIVERVHRIHVDRENEKTYRITPKENGFSLCCEENAEYQNLILYGIQAETVLVDGTEVSATYDVTYKRTIVKVSVPWQLIEIKM